LNETIPHIFQLQLLELLTEQSESVALPDIVLDDTLLIHHQELIPADGILTRVKH
jgi:Cu+-exporting ATPase